MPKREKEGNQKCTDFYLPDLQEDSDPLYTKLQDKQKMSG